MQQCKREILGVVFKAVKEAGGWVRWGEANTRRMPFGEIGKHWSEVEGRVSETAIRALVRR